ncbi:UNVERIFIED_CONTAM: Mitogen-activated protein kinase kinase kinase YODA [Sesamum latifolium]|uniref:Mitogen-activated protein kinase kinase kinase YODA n=1 Tax=Sesamum latifolium TaxID=2727402 RepID=A0AAW2T8K9_9LAMI
MSMIYDNWERLVAAVLKKEQLWQLFHDQSRSPSISSESSGLSFSFGGVLQLKMRHFQAQNGQLLNRREKMILVLQDTSEYRRNISPRMGSPTSSSRVHPRAGGGHNKPQTNWPEDAKQKGHPLPLPPVAISSSSPVSRPNSAATSPTLPSHSPERAGNLKSPSTNSAAISSTLPSHSPERAGNLKSPGEMCAMKEVKLSSDDAMSKQLAMVLEIELSVLSQLRHPNILQYYGAEMVGDNLYIYSEYVSGGSISRILQEYGKLGESAIRRYTHQILSGLAYIHSRSISHRDIKAATILVDPNGRIKLASFGIEKHIIGQSHPSLLRESPYWMAPEVIMSPSVRNPAIDIWSLGCTVLEIATSKPPMSQFKQEVAMLKVACHKELPTIPGHLSDDCKDFVRRCLQWNPKHRATAAQLLEHPFVKSSSPSVVKPEVLSTSSAHPAVPNVVKPEDNDHATSSHHSDSRRLANHFSSASRVTFRQGFPTSPVSPVGSPLPHPRSPQLLNGRLSLPSIPTSSKLLSGGIGDTPYTHFNQSMLRQENFRHSPKQSPTVNSPSYWDPAILRGKHSGIS